MSARTDLCGGYRAIGIPTAISGNVYENKGPNDNVPDTKYDISAWLNGILHKDTRILQKLTALS